MKYFYALMFIVGRAFGVCLVSFALLWLLFFGFMFELLLYFAEGVALIVMSKIAMDKFLERNWDGR